MKNTVLIIAMIAGVSFGGIPIQWDVRVGYDQRFNESSPVAYNITAMRGETLDLMPRYMSSGYPFSIASNADVRIYLREYGTTNAFTVSSTSGTVYTTSSQLGRVRAVLLPSDIPATGTNQFFVGVESSGMVYRAYGKLTVLDSPGVIASTNQIQRGVFDSSMFTFANSHLAPWSLSDIGNYCGVQSVNGLTGVVSITAESLGALTNVPPQSYTIITNAPWAHETNTASIMITNGLASTSYVAAAVSAIPAAHSAYWPPNATASSWFTFVTNSGAITITGYANDGGADVVIPDYINGWPVTEIGANAFAESGVTSIGGAGNVVTVGNYAFAYCTPLASVSLPQVQTVGVYAFYNCYLLTSVPLPQVQTVGDSAFAYCYLLTSVSLPQVQTVGVYAFYGCGGLTSLYFDNDAPTIGADIFAGIPNQVTNYVTNPTATGWGATLAGMPVVRLPLYADAIYQAGELVATTQHVAQAITDEAAMRADADTSITGSIAAVSGAFVTYTNTLPVAGNTLIELTDVTNIVLTGATYAYRAMPDVAYRLSVPTNAPAVHYGITILSTNACTLSDNLLLRGTKTVTGTNCVAFQPWTNGTWEVLWGGK